MWILKLRKHWQYSFLKGYAEFTYSIHKIHHGLGKVPCVLFALVSFILRMWRKETEKHAKTVWSSLFMLVWMEPKGKNAIFTYHTVVNDNHDLQILCLVKYADRRLWNKHHQSLTAHRLFSSSTTGAGRLLLKSVASLTRSKTYLPLFPALQPGEFIELGEELLLRNCEHKHVCKSTYLEPNSGKFFPGKYEFHKNKLCMLHQEHQGDGRYRQHPEVHRGSETEDFLWRSLPSSSGSLFQLKEAVLLTLWGLAAVSWKIFQLINRKTGLANDRKNSYESARYILVSFGVQRLATLLYCNLRLNESVVRAQLDTYELRRQTSHCRMRERCKGERRQLIPSQ